MKQNQEKAKKDGKRKSVAILMQTFGKSVCPKKSWNEWKKENGNKWKKKSGKKLEKDGFGTDGRISGRADERQTDDGVDACEINPKMSQKGMEKISPKKKKPEKGEKRKKNLKKPRSKLVYFKQTHRKSISTNFQSKQCLLGFFWSK